MGSLLGKDSRCKHRFASISTGPKPPIKVHARKLRGISASVEVLVLPSETVVGLKELLAPQFGVQATQLQLVRGTSTLQNDATLEDCAAVVANDELSVELVPDWAEKLGLSQNHPDRLRQYFAEHGLSKKMRPNMTNDEDLWSALEILHRDCSIVIKKDGQLCPVLYAARGEELSINVSGHQKVECCDGGLNRMLFRTYLVMDTAIVDELCPGDLREINWMAHYIKVIDKHVSFKAPSEPGTCMLWLMHDYERHNGESPVDLAEVFRGLVASRTVNIFVGWLVVE